MADLEKIQKKRNTLLLAPKRRLTSVVKPTTVDTTPESPTTPYAPSSSINTSAGSGTSVIAPTITNTPTTGAPATVAPSAPKTNPITDTLKNAAIVGGTTLAAKAIIDHYTKPAAPATKPAAPVTKPPAAPVVKPPTSVVIPPASQKEQDAQVAAANTAKAAADHNALAGSFDQGTKVGLDYNTIPNNTPAEAGTIDESMFDFEDEYVQDDLGNIYKMIDDKPVLIRSPEVDEDISEEDYDLFGYSPEDTDQGTEVGLDYNTIPNNTPAEAGTIDESMFDDPNGVELEDVDLDDPNDPMNTFKPDGVELEDVDLDDPNDPMNISSAEPVLVQDEAGNYFIANADGSYSPADASGNAVGEPMFIGGNEAGGGTDYADSGYGDTALDTGGYGGDDVGGYEAYDDQGNLWFVGDDGSFSLVESAYVEPDFGYDFDTDFGYYEEPPPYIEPDLSYLDDFTYEYPNYGYDFDFDLGYYDEPPAYYESDLSYLDDYKRGGQVQKMKKGGLPHFYTGGGAGDYIDSATYSDFGYEAEASPVNMGGGYEGTDYENMIPTATDSNPASYADMEYLYSEDPTNSDSSAYYTTVNNDSSGYYPNQASNMEESVFNPFDLSANEVLMEDEEGRKFAVDQDTGDYRLIEDSKFPTNSDPRSPNTTPYPATPTPKTTSTTSGGGSGFNFKDIFSTDNIKALAGAGLGAAGLISLYNSMKDKDPTYTPAGYTPPAIPKRTTDFGMGPARTVAPQMGGLQVMTPSQQEELYTNLGVPGYEMEHEDPVEDQPMADGGYAQPQPNQSTAPSYFTYGMPQDPLEVLGIKQPQQKSEGGGLQMRQGGLPHPVSGVPVVQGRHDYRQGAAVKGEGDGQSDDIPAMLADGEYVFDADVVAALGNGSNKAGAEVLDKFREEIRAHKRSADVNKIPPKAKSPLTYLKEAQA